MVGCAALLGLCACPGGDREARAPEPPLVAIEPAQSAAASVDEEPLPTVAPAPPAPPARHLADATPADRAVARALLMVGVKKLDSGDAAGALVEIQKAYDIVPVPTVAVLLARCLIKLGRKVEARRIIRQVVRAPVEPGAPAAFARARQEAIALDKSLGP